MSTRLETEHCLHGSPLVDSGRSPFVFGKNAVQRQCSALQWQDDAIEAGLSDFSNHDCASCCSMPFWNERYNGCLAPSDLVILGPAPLGQRQRLITIQLGYHCYMAWIEMRNHMVIWFQYGYMVIWFQKPHACNPLNLVREFQGSCSPASYCNSHDNLHRSGELCLPSQGRNRSAKMILPYVAPKRWSDWYQYIGIALYCNPKTIEVGKIWFWNRYKWLSDLS
jgi:hypothetical protein